MAQSFDVNLHIGSELGFTLQKRVSLLGSNIPQIQTLLNLNGDVFTPSEAFTVFNNARLSVDNLDDFITTTLVTSTYQTVLMTNIGNGVLTITNILYSGDVSLVTPRVIYTPPNILTSTTDITILPGNTATFELAYIGWPGVYDAEIYIQSNNSGGYYKIPTHQVINRSKNFFLPVTSFSTSTDQLGQHRTYTYEVVPVFDTFDRPDLEIPVFGVTTGSSGWTILSTGTNAITVDFDSSLVNNINGTYISELTITANDSWFTVTNTAIVSIDYTNMKNYSTWLSPAGHYNSIIGISYDLIKGERNLTIGVGMGGEDSPIYDNGGDANVDVANLGIGKEIVNYPYWSKVYRIPLTTSTNTYYSSDYVVKTTATTTVTDYSVYFGDFEAVGSMFIVDDNGHGSLRIKMNNLQKDLSAVSLDDSWTLKNLVEAFHYYSENYQDFNNGRYSGQATEYSAPRTLDTSTTYLFLGFDYNKKTDTTAVKTSIVPLP